MALQAKFPWVTWARCVTHAIDLIMKDFCKQPEILELLKSARAVVRWVRSHHHPHALFRESAKEKGCDFALKLPGMTRFGSNLLMIDRLLEVLPALKHMVHSEKFSTWVKSQDSYTRAVGKSIASLIDDSGFVKDMCQIRDLLMPVLKRLRKFDSNDPVIGEVYPAMAELKQSVLDSEAPAAMKDSLLSIVTDRWEFLHSDIHAAAYIVNPRYMNVVGDLINDTEIMDGFHNMAFRLSKDSDEASDIVTELLQK